MDRNVGCIKHVSTFHNTHKLAPYHSRYKTWLLDNMDVHVSIYEAQASMEKSGLGSVLLCVLDEEHRLHHLFTTIPCLFSMQGIPLRAATSPSH